MGHRDNLIKSSRTASVAYGGILALGVILAFSLNTLQGIPVGNTVRAIIKNGGDVRMLGIYGMLFILAMAYRYLPVRERMSSLAAARFLAIMMVILVTWIALIAVCVRLLSYLWRIQ